MTLLLFFFLPLACVSIDAAVYGQVVRVYDGDTIEVEGIGRVRLLGIDAPEHEASDRDRFYQHQFHIGPAILRTTARQATNFVIRHSRYQKVRLEFDEQQRDRYNRVLAYVYLPDGRMLNLMLIEEGLATVFRREEFRQKARFFEAEEQARLQRRGLWRNSNPAR